MTPRRLPLLAALALLAPLARAGDQAAPTVAAPSGGPSAVPTGQTQLNTLNVQGAGVTPEAIIPPAGAADAELGPAASPGAQPGAAAPGQERAAAERAEVLRGALDPGVARGGMQPRAASQDAAAFGRAVSPASPAAGGVGSALDRRYENSAAGLSSFGGPAGLGAVAGLAPTLAKQVAHEVEQGNKEASRHGAQAASSARAALAFYQTAVNLVAKQFESRRVGEEQYKTVTAQVLEQARAHAVTRELRDEAGAKRQVGALQSLAAGVVPGNRASVDAFASSAKAWSRFMSVDIPNLEDVTRVLMARSGNGLAPAIPFYRRDEKTIEADLSGVKIPAAAAKSPLVIVPANLAAQMKLGAPGGAPPALAAEAAEMPSGWLARLPANAHLRERAGRSAPVAWAQALWASARSAVRAVWEAAASVLSRVYGLLHPARLDVGGAPLVSSDRALRRLSALAPRRAQGLDGAGALVLSVDLSALSASRPDLAKAAALHAALTGDSSALWFDARAGSAAQRDDWRLKIADKALSQIDRELLRASSGRVVAYADLSSGVGRLLVRAATPVESAALQGLGFEAQPSGGVWIGTAWNASRPQLEAALRLLGGAPQPAFDAAAVARAFASAKRAASTGDFRDRRPVGELEIRGARWLVERTRTLLLFSNPDTHQVRFAAPLP